MLKVIAKESGMDSQEPKSTIATMKFPSANDQLSKTWLGGNAQKFMKGVADVFVKPVVSIVLCPATKIRSTRLLWPQLQVCKTI